MNGTLQIAVDLEEGEVRLGSERVRLLPGRGDAFYLVNRRGPMVRALRFEERSLLLNTNAANGDVAALIAGAAFVSSGECVDQVRVAVSLALAGGGEEAPSFSECARLVEESAGWNPEQVSGTMALVIDRLCGSMKQQESQNGWERIVFQEDEADLETLISRMAANLAQRAVPSAPVAKTEAEERSTPNEPKRMKSELSQTKQQRDWAASRQAQPSRSISQPVSLSSQTTEPQRPPVFRSISSATSVATPTDRSAKRIPARVLAPAATNQPNPTIAFSRPSARIASTAEAAIAQQTNQPTFSITQTAPVVFEQPLLTSPRSTGWQQFKPAVPNLPPTQAPAQSETRFSSPTTESPSFDDWLSELATLLEAECDMRGIDP